MVLRLIRTHGALFGLPIWGAPPCEACPDAEEVTSVRLGRRPDELRPLSMERDVAKFADGSALVRLGDTHVLCTAKSVDGVPAWRRGTGAGWLTAEYSMLPAATADRMPREAVRGKQGGRTMEIQRLIGRSLRAVVDLGSLGERTIYIDCDVIQADGGTRTAAISGAYVALVMALERLRPTAAGRGCRCSRSSPRSRSGVVDGEPRLDLDYEEDSAAALDMNVVMTGDGRLVEVQATAEGEPFPRATLDLLLDLAAAGVARIATVQQATIAGAGAGPSHDAAGGDAWMRFVLATRNPHKLAEYRAILAPHDVGPMPAGIELPPEGVVSFEANARAKAEGLARALRAGAAPVGGRAGRRAAAAAGDAAVVVADDSGIEWPPWAARPA